MRLTRLSPTLHLSRLTWTMLMLFAPVRGLSGQEPAEVQQEAAWIDMTAEFEGAIIFMEVSVETAGPYWFILDTGAPTSYMDKSLAESLGLEVLSRSIERDSNRLTSFLKNPVHLTAKGFNHVASGVIVGELDRWFSPLVGRSVTGLLGVDFVRENVIEIDYQQERVRLCSPEGFRYQGEGTVIPAILSTYVWVNVLLTAPGGQATGVMAILDTGYDGALSMTRRQAQALEIDSGESTTVEASTQSLYAVGVDQYFRLNALELARFKLAAVPIGVRDDALIAGAPDTFLGADLLARFTLILDLKRQRIILEPNDEFASPFRTDCTGMGVAAQGEQFDRFVVKVVHDNSPGSEAGFKVGDIIVMVEGLPASEYTVATMRELVWESLGEELKFQVLRGEETLDLVLVPRERY
ncbi:MAG: aspartyl protease family protein [Planctomycetota bacterium]